MPDPRPLSEITAEAKQIVRRLRADTQIWNVERLCDLMAELSGRLDGAVVLTREEAELALGALNMIGPDGTRPGIRLWETLVGRLEDLCGRPGKETE